MASRSRLILFAAGAAAAVLAAVYFLRDRQPEDVLRASGTIEATEVDTSFQVSGKISEVLVREGEPVNQGDLLARMSSDELQSRVSQIQASLDAVRSQARQQEAALEMRRGIAPSQIRQAEAQVEATRMMLERLQEGARPQEIRVAETAVAQSEAEVERLRSDFQRISTLLERGAVSRQEYEASRAASLRAEESLKASQQQLALLREGARSQDVAEAEARLRAAQAGVDIAQAGSGEIDVQLQVLRAAQARERELKAQLDTANTQLGYTEMRAPIKGVVLLRNAEGGEVVNAGNPVVTLGDIENLWMNIYVPETQTGLVRLGSAVRVRVDSFPNEEFAGSVSFISPQSEFTPKTIQTEEERVRLVYRVKVTLKNSEQKLKPGMPADAEIALR